MYKAVQVGEAQALDARGESDGRYENAPPPSSLFPPYYSYYCDYIALIDQFCGSRMMSGWMIAARPLEGQFTHVRDLVDFLYLWSYTENAYVECMEKADGNWVTT